MAAEKVECPDCGSKQSVPDSATFYQCRACGSDVTFAVCKFCSVRNPIVVGTRWYTCFNCGRSSRVARNVAGTVGLILAFILALVTGAVGAFLGGTFFGLVGAIGGAAVSFLIGFGYYLNKWQEGLEGKKSDRGGGWFVFWSGD